MHRHGPVRCTAPVASQRPQHWSGHRDQRRAKPQCLGSVETVFHTTGCDQPGVRAGAPDSAERIYRRQTPVEERLEQGGVLAARAGPKAAGKNALVGGVLLALIEGLGILITKMMAPPMASKDDLKHGGADPTLPPTQPGLAPPVAFPTGAAY